MSYERVPVLDHGYAQVIDVWGSDERIVEAARMSTGKGFLGWGPVHDVLCLRAKAVEACVFNYGPDHDKAQATLCTCEPKAGDEKLLKFLWDNRHQTPFEMGGLTIESQAPIFVYREWHRHRVPFGYNEMSARYTPLPDVNYVPSVERLLINSKTNKQAGTIKGAGELDEAGAVRFQSFLRASYAHAEAGYQEALHAGVPKELARVHLPVGRYSRMRATSNLRGWLGFLTLRMAPGAQWEIRQYANAVGDMVKAAFPRTWEVYAGDAPK